MLAAGQPETIVADQTELENVRLTKPAFPTWRLVWHVPTLLEVFVGIFVVFYLSAAVALAGALLFYTFKQ